MMIDPPIDALARKTNGNKYVLANLISKRAKEIETLRRVQESDDAQKSISQACEEVYLGKVVPNSLNF